mmetsp:Transcript_176/g.427  ORF Transcript_176/g.427 Transcript_176/m.427 type:complete len:202 (+) Transcript_176:76-681(+)
MSALATTTTATSTTTNPQNHHDWRIRLLHDENDSMMLISKTDSNDKRQEQSSNKSCTRRRVRFYPTVKVTLVECIQNLLLNEQQDVSRIWYSQKEFARIRDLMGHDVELLTTGRVVEGDEYTMRGLESWTRAGYERKRRNKTSALYAVLDEQERQHRLRKQNTKKKNDPEASLARMYNLETKECIEDALDQGIIDEEDASY